MTVRSRPNNTDQLVPTVTVCWQDMSGRGHLRDDGPGVCIPHMDDYALPLAQPLVWADPVEALRAAKLAELVWIDWMERRLEGR